MAQSCAPGHHVASAPVIRNQGFDFAKCRDCACDLIRSNRSWKSVPSGFRVVWRGPDRPLTEDPMQLLLNLPPVGRDLMPANATSRSVSGILMLLRLALDGLRYFAWGAFDRMRQNRNRNRPSARRTAVLRLPSF